MGAFFGFAAAIWAYGVVVVKNIQCLNAFHINFYFGCVLTIMSGLLYPIVESKTSIETLLYGFLYFGSPIAIGNILYTHALKINHNTGLTTLCISEGVVVGYLISIFRYN
jgi:hypothetical protein